MNTTRTEAARKANEAVKAHLEANPGRGRNTVRLTAESQLEDLIAWAYWCDSNGDFRLLSDACATVENAEFSDMTRDERTARMWAEIDSMLQD